MAKRFWNLPRRIVASLLGLFFFLPAIGTAQFNGHTFPASEDLLIRVTEEGITPANFTMRARQGILFILNDTRQDLITLEMEFGEHAMTCFSSATENLAFKDGTRLVSTRPLAPGNFATTCFPQIGRYHYTIYGLSKYPQGINGTIEVVWPTR